MPSEYKDLTLGVKFNGLPLLATGPKYRYRQPLTLEVGTGYDTQVNDSLPADFGEEIITDSEPEFLE